jgi:phosphate-selective porin OprO/OprP
LKASSAADVAEVRRVASEQPVVTIANGRPTIASSDGAFTASLRGVVQFDAASYFDNGDDAVPGSASATNDDLNSGTNFRRVRLGLEGTIARDWLYNLTAEYGGSAAESTQLNQAWLEYGGWRPFGTQVRLRAGAFAIPVNLEDATSNTESLFIERPSPAEVPRSIAAGDGRVGFAAYANGERWSAVAALTGERVNQSGNFDEQSGYVARFAFLPIRSPDYAVHLGVNTSGVLETSDTSAGTGTTEKAFSLGDYPELRVSSQQFASVAFAADTLDTIEHYGLEVGGYWKNFYLASEFVEFNVDRLGGATDPEFDGWYVQGAWTITGERRSWSAANGGFQGIRPTNNFSLADDKWGAWEIAARYSQLNLNDVSAGVTGGDQTITTLGLNWYPHRSVRFILEGQDVEVDFPGATTDVEYQALALRSQVAF